MILTEVKFYSETLTLQSTMHVLLPQRPLAEAQKKPQKKFRTLYLLHGHSDDHTAWQRWTSIERYVEGLNLAVVMPAVHLSFHNDMLMEASTGNLSAKKCQRLCVICFRYLPIARIILWLAYPWADMVHSSWH